MTLDLDSRRITITPAHFKAYLSDLVLPNGGSQNVIFQFPLFRVHKGLRKPKKVKISISRTCEKSLQ